MAFISFLGRSGEKPIEGIALRKSGSSRLSIKLVSFLPLAPLISVGSEGTSASSKFYRDQ
jgi:hypothetical protein